MSSPSYLLSKFAPMTANLSEFSGSRGIFFVSLAGWKEPCTSQSLGLGHNPFQHLLLFCHHEGLGQPATGHGALDGLLVVAGYRDDPLRARIFIFR